MADLAFQTTPVVTVDGVGHHPARTDPAPTRSTEATETADGATDATEATDAAHATDVTQAAGPSGTTGDVTGTVLPEGAEAERYTVDELAARTGMTVRTVRFYASEGMLPAPHRQGRMAYYDTRHRLRLELIRTLQEHGYTNAAVTRVLERIAPDAPAAEYLVHGAVLAPWLPDRTEVVDAAQLAERTGVPIDDGVLASLVRVGAAEDLGEGRYRVAPSLVAHAVDLLDMPVPPSFVGESAALIDEHATAVADGLTELFARTIWGPYQRGELSHEQVVEMLARIRPLAIAGLVGAFTRAADHAARRRLETS